MAGVEKPADWPLEPPVEAMDRLVRAAMDRILAHIASLPAQPSFDLESAEAIADSLAEDLPEQGAEPGGLLDLLFDTAVPKSFNAAGPGYLAYIPGGGIFPAAVADLIADSVNRYTGVWLPAPALVALEMNVLRWLCALVGYPKSALGFLTTGGSLANLSGVITARHERLPENFLNGTLYVSDQAHHSLQKAARLAGFPHENVRVIATDDAFRIRIDALERAISEDRAKGMAPFLLVASAGTTNSGAVDDLVACGAVAKREKLWFHVDGAYGGFFAATERGRRILAGLTEADTIVLDPHKGLFLPYGTGCLLARDVGALRRAHSVPAIYLPSMQEDPSRVDFSEISPELSRDFRGLRVWLPFKMFGASAFRAALDEKLDLAQWAYERLREMDGIEIVAAPQLTTVVFRAAPRAGAADGAALDDLNRRFLDRVNGKKRVYLSGTVLRGRFVLRICVLSFRTHMDRMEMAIEDIRSSLAELSSG